MHLMHMRIGLLKAKESHIYLLHSNPNVNRAFSSVDVILTSAHFFWENNHTMGIRYANKPISRAQDR
jgi:hypothetical protein